MKYKMILVVVVGFVVCMALAVFSHSQAASNFGSLEFAASGSTLKFFDTSTGEIYIYSDIDGKLYSKYTLTELGKKLESKH